MQTIELNSGARYNLAPGGIVDIRGNKIQITVIPDNRIFSQIESDFSLESNTKKIKIVDEYEEIISIKRNYTFLESIAKINNSVIGNEEYIDNDGEIMYRDVIGVACKIVLSKPDLYSQVQDIQETMDMIVLSELEG